MQKNQTVEGEVWQRPCHDLLSLPLCPEHMVNDYLILRGPHCRERIFRQSLTKNYKGRAIR
jgi:hypothetical protein